MQTIRTKVLFITLLFSAVMLPTMMQASEKSDSIHANKDKDFIALADLLYEPLNEKGHYTRSSGHVIDEGAVDELMKRGVNINVKDAIGYTHLACSAVFFDTCIAKILLNKNANVNMPDSDKKTPLMLAIFCNIHIDTLSLARNADVNQLDSNNITPLMKIIKPRRGTEKNRLKFIELLLNHRAEDTGKNDDDETIWDYAKGKPEIMKLLKNHFKR